MTAAGPMRSRNDVLRWAAPVLAGVLLLGLIALFASMGGHQGPLAGLAAVLYVVVCAGAPAAAYLAAGVGLGRLLAPLYGGARERLAIQAGAGIALLLSLSHLLGWAGAFGGRAGTVVAAGVCGLGLVLLADQVVRTLRRPSPDAPRSGGWMWAAWGAPALALLVVAACSPPGWLWDSEGRGYDALEYHLQLPQEWLRLGRLRPLEHNVYSFLPGYVEAAFYHLAAATGAPAGPAPGSPAFGLLAGEGLGVLSAQFLSAGVAGLSALMVGRLVIAAWRVGRTNAEAGRGASIAASLSGAIFLSIPWVIVTGSLPYNDLGVALLLAGAMIAALEPGLSPARKGMAVGLLIGVACGVKPTAIFLAMPPAAVLLAGALPARRWAPAFAGAAAVGALALGPWLIRNWIASGNPVFPGAASVFGSGHWSAEQVARFGAAHRFQGGLLERLSLLVLPGPPDPATGVAAPRGLLHPQWSIFFALAAAGAVAALAGPRRRLAALLVMGFGAQLAAWLFATHLQARFLIPCGVTGSALIGLALAGLGEGRSWQRLVGPGAAALALLVLAGHAVLIFGSQGWLGPGSRPLPNAFLAAGPPAMTGEDLRPALGNIPAGERDEWASRLGVAAYANLGLPAGSRLYLLGDSRPLYYTVPVIYATTFDRSVLGAAMARAPRQPREWTASLRAAGATHILVSYAELARLERSGFLDPDLRIGAIREWLGASTRLLRAWPPGGEAAPVVEIRELPREGAP